MDRIGKYEISRLLGEGATSSVYLGFDPFTQREVAIKRLHPETLRGSERSMLYRHLLLNEASLAGKLQHPHIIQIHDAVIDDKDAYVVMEYVPGGTLEAFTKADNLLPFERAPRNTDERAAENACKAALPGRSADSTCSIVTSACCRMFSRLSRNVAKRAGFSRMASSSLRSSDGTTTV